MHSKAIIKLKRLNLQQRVILGIAIVAIVLVAFAILRPTERSVSAYCKVYKEQKEQLAMLPGDAYPSGVFNEAISDAGAFAAAFDRLERVAPSEIQPDVKTLRAIYQKIDDDPSQALTASLSAISPDENVRKWVSDHCESTNL